MHEARPAFFGIPNLISAARFPLAALFPLADDVVRIAIVVAAAATDWVDGRIARHTGQVTRGGELLDPIADKTFMLVVLLTLVLEQRLPVWTLPLLLTRDIGVAIGAAIVLLRGTPARMSARKPGKVVTWLQFTGIACILIFPATAPWVAVPVAVAGLYALVDYRRALDSPSG